jgi:TolA-binding protein
MNLVVMTYFSRLALIPAVIFASASPLFADISGWADPQSPARFNIEPDKAGNSQGALSWVAVNLPDPRWNPKNIRVFSESGTALATNILWTAPGEPTIVLFDTTTPSRKYEVYVGGSWTQTPIADTKSGVWMETREGNGKLVANLPDMIQAFDGSTKVLGRAITNGVDEGGNRFGTQGNLFIHFQGFFDVGAQEHLDFGIFSADPAFVSVDGKDVVDWPGQHGWGTGPAGPPQAGVDLAPGRHVLDVYNDYIATPNGDPPVMCTLAVKGGPFEKWGVLDPNNTLIRTATRNHVTSYEAQTDAAGAVPNGVAAMAADYSNEEQSVINTDTPDIGFIALQLTALNPLTLNTITWTFDDGTTATGQSVKHLFPRPGLRTVHMQVKDNFNAVIGSAAQVVNVHPDWAHAYKQPDLLPDHETEIAKRDPSTMSGPDLSSCFAMFGFYGEQDHLLTLLPYLSAKIKDVPDGDLPFLKNAAMLLVREDTDHVADETKLLQALADRASAVTQPTPAISTAISEIRLTLVHMLIKTTVDTKQLADLVAGIDPSKLTGDDQRAFGILKGDLALASGDIEGARKQYQALTGAPSGPDERSSVRRTAMIGQARAFIDRKDYAAAEAALTDVVWQAPIDKLSSDWALTRLRLYQAEDMPVAAYLWAKRIMPLITDDGDGRSELLFRMTDLAFAQKDNDLANKSLSELLKKHPYTQEAAQAKTKWPGKS